MPVSSSRSEFYQLSSSLSALSQCNPNDDPEKYKKKVKEGYKILKYSTGADNIDEVISKVSQTLRANISETSENHFQNIEEGLDILRRNIHVLSQSERNFFTRLILRYFPKWDYSIKESQKEHKLFQTAQLLYRVSLGKEERAVFQRYKLEHYKTSVARTASDDTFQELSGAILGNYHSSSGSHGKKLSDLHQAVMKAYLKNEQKKREGKKHWDLETIEDFYTAMILGGEKYLKPQELGFLRDLALNGVHLYNFESHAAFTFITKAICTIHRERPERSILENAKIFEQHYASNSSETRKLLSRASRRVLTHKGDPKEGVKPIADLIQKKEFQRVAAYHLEYLLNGEVSFETRLQAFESWINNTIEEYYKENSPDETLVVDVDVNNMFYSIPWIAARSKINKDTLHQLETMLHLWDLTDPTSRGSHTFTSILAGLSAATTIFAEMPKKASSKS